MKTMRIAAIAAVLISTSSLAQANPNTSTERWGAHPETFRYSLGFERALSGSGATAGADIGPFPNDALVIGRWFSPRFGLDLDVGISRTSDTFATNTTTTAAPDTTVETYTGTKSATNLFLGATVKYRWFQNEWLQVYVGSILGLRPGTKVEQPTGTRTTTGGTTTEANYGTVTTERGTQFVIGPKLGAQFYPKWFPHVALGFATGIAFQFGGSTKTTTSTADKDAAGTVTDQTTTIANGDGRSNITTFGLGGTTFSLVTAFNVRYEF